MNYQHMTDDRLQEFLTGLWPSGLSEEVRSALWELQMFRRNGGCLCDPPGSGEEWCIGTCEFIAALRELVDAEHEGGHRLVEALGNANHVLAQEGRS